MIMPTTGVSRSIRRSTCGRSRRASRWMAVPTMAAASPMTRAQPNSAMSGRAKWGRPGTARENVPSPVSASRPTKTRAPTPEASRPGSRTTPSMGPPRPEASISRNAPRIGEPSRVLMAAKLPAAATTALARAGMSRLASRTASRASPPPSAISGASGPRTTPRLRVARAASSTPGSWAGVGAPRPGLNPSAGDSPPLPGRNRMTGATSRPATVRTGSGHHGGAP